MNFASTFKNFQSTLTSAAEQTARGLEGAVASVDLASTSTKLTKWVHARYNHRAGLGC